MGGEGSGGREGESIVIGGGMGWRVGGGGRARGRVMAGGHALGRLGGTVGRRMMGHGWQGRDAGRRVLGANAVRERACGDAVA